MRGLNDLGIVTALFERGYGDCIATSIENWLKSFPNAQFFVLSPKDMFGQIPETATPIEAVDPSAYGVCYNYAINFLLSKGIKNFLIVAPYSVPSQWLAGSLANWVESYDLIGIYKPPRFLHASFGTTILELGRLNMDFIYFSGELAFCADFSFKSWNVGTLLIRVRPGGWLIFNALTFGASVLTLPSHCKPISYLSRNLRRERFVKNQSQMLKEQLKEFKGGKR